MHARSQWLDPAGAGDHLDRLYRAAWALCRDREEADDLVQETYARVLARPRFLRQGDALAYLLSALRKTFLHQLRASERQLSGTGASVDADPIDLRADMRPDLKAEAREVYAAIATLPVDLRLTLVAIDVVGLSQLETAEALRIPAGTVRSRTFRARERVAATLSTPAPDPPATSDA